MTPIPKHVPAGYHSVTPHLVVDGAAAAIAFYKQAFGAVEVGRHTMKNGRIGYAAIDIAESRLMLGDPWPEDEDARGPEVFGGSPVTLHLFVDDVDAWLARAVSAGATLLRAAADQFYGERNGRIKDPFGYRWEIATHKEDVSFEEIARRAASLGF